MFGLIIKFDENFNINVKKINNYKTPEKNIEISNGVMFIEEHENEYIIIGNSFENVLKEILKPINDYETVLKIAKEIIKQIGMTINPQQLIINLFPNKYINFLNRKNKVLLKK